MNAAFRKRSSRIPQHFRQMISSVFALQTVTKTKTSPTPKQIIKMLPWEISDPNFRHFKSPFEQWQVMPSFLVGELLFYIIGICAIIHAYRSFKLTGSYDNLVILVCSVIAGTANDCFFMALSGLPDVGNVDNFWQAQACIMITPRLPLYIPVVYLCFMYYPCVTARVFVLERRKDFNWAISPQRIAKSPAPLRYLANIFFSTGYQRVALGIVSGIMGFLFYYPYDVVGAKFLWWTWHDSDLSISQRILGAPASSSLWTLTFVAIFSILVDWRLEIWNDNSKKSTSKKPSSSFSFSLKNFMSGLLAVVWPVALFSTPVMMVEMGILQLSEYPNTYPGYRSLAIGCVLFFVLEKFSLYKQSSANDVAFQTKMQANNYRLYENNIFLVVVVTFYCVVLVVIGAVFNPEYAVSVGVHQTTGPCDVYEKDITRSTRQKYLCVSDFEEPYQFCPKSATPKKNEKKDWYQICGTKMDSRLEFVWGVAWRGILVIYSIAKAML